MTTSDANERRLIAILSADVVGFSRMMEADERGTLARLQALRRELLKPEIGQRHGHIVKLMGDGLLAKFSSVSEAVEAALAIQRGMTHRNIVTTEAQRILLRIGINLGDVIVVDDDIYGDGVNVAARLEAMAPPGGICLSDIVQQGIAGKLDLALESMGKQTLKNITRPIQVWCWNGDHDVLKDDNETIGQEIRFCTTRDGHQIAIGTAGSGPPLVKTPNWMSHLEYDWDSPVFRPLLLALARNHLLVRYDQRGHGLSDWDVGKLTLESWVDDLETVVDAVGLDRFALFGISQGAPVSIAYAVRHPEKVSRLVLHGGTARGWAAGPNSEVLAQHEAMATLIRSGWGKESSGMRQLYTSLFLPDASTTDGRWFNEVQRASSNAENAAQLYDTFGHADVSDLLPKVAAPTLVTHCRGDRTIPYKAGRAMASGIPGARFVSLDSNNHVLLEDEPAYQRFMSEIEQFLAD